MQDAISAQFHAAIVEEKKAEAIAQSDRFADRRIPFASDRDSDRDRDRDDEIYTMRPDGTDVRQLTRSGAEYWSPAWFPDGTRIVVYSYRDGDGAFYIMWPNATYVRQLTVNDAEDGANLAS